MDAVSAAVMTLRDDARPGRVVHHGSIIDSTPIAQVKRGAPAQSPACHA
jgi:hypothetical protein